MANIVLREKQINVKMYKTRHAGLYATINFYKFVSTTEAGLSLRKGGEESPDSTEQRTT